MEFEVRSGNYYNKIIAENFQAAAHLFIAIILREEPNAEFGELTQVEHKAKKYFILTDNLLPQTAFQVC